MTSKPRELIHATMLDGLAQRYSVPPSVILNEPTSILRMVAVAEAGNMELHKDK